MVFLADESTLAAVVSEGLGGVAHMRELELWCLNQAELTADARYCSIARAFRAVADVWDSHHALPNYVLGALSQVFSEQLQSVLDAPDVRSGTQLARDLRRQVFEIIRQWDGSLVQA